VFEVLDNSIDEHLAGFCDHITVTIHVDGSVSIRDDGRGIPVDTHPKFKIPAVELVLTNLHAGGKFGQGAYKYSGGLHGVGAKCVNALSEWFKVEVSRDGEVHTMEFERGKTTRKLEVIGKSKSTGTLVTFKPDPQIFTITTEFNFNMLSTRMRELAFLNPGVEIRLVDDREDDNKSDLHARMNTGCITRCSRCWTIRLMSTWLVSVITLRSQSMWMVRLVFGTMDVESRWTHTQNSKSPLWNWCSPIFTPEANSGKAPTNIQVVCTASAPSA
jgi:hypothetical protein